MAPCRIRLIRMSLPDIAKFVLGILFGYSLNNLINFSMTDHELDMGTTCQRFCHKESASERESFLKQDPETEIVKGYNPRTLYDVIRYEYFNETAIINNFDDDPKIGLLGHHKQDIHDITDRAVRLFNSGKSDRWKFRKLYNGYRRFDPARGEEYILDIELVKESNSSASMRYKFEMVKPFSWAQTVDSEAYSDTTSKKVNLILPLYGMTERLKSFMENFETVCLKTKENVGLTLVVFTGEQREDDSAVVFIKSTVQSLKTKYPTADIKIILTENKFSRALGIDLGSHKLDVNSVMFFCDVDVIFSREFLHRCRLHSKKDEQVYYPILFAQYQRDIVDKFSPVGKVKDHMEINRFTGFWVHYGFGMACMYKADYGAVGGFDTKIHGWGGEDVDLYLRHVKSPIKVLRAMEPGLVHIHHRKTCAPDLTDDQRRMCVDSMADGIASKQQLGKLVVTNNCKV